MVVVVLVEVYIAPTQNRSYGDFPAFVGEGRPWVPQTVCILILKLIALYHSEQF
jgi:hypothetical protein